MTRKTASFSQLLKYIETPQDKGKDAILHNLQSSSLREITQEFYSNARHCPKRKNGVKLYHEILSFSEADKEKVTEDILLDIGREYLQMRAPETLGFAKAHLNTQNPHLHIVISGNLLESSKKLRLSKTQFNQVKRELEQYQKEKYPFLTHSFVFTQKSQHKGKSQAEHERDRRHEQQGKKEPSKKKLVKKQILDYLMTSYSLQEFSEKLQATGFEFYQRGNTPGVKDTQTGRKYRLKTLGVLEEFERALQGFERVERRREEVKTIQIEKQHQNIRDISL